MTADAKTVTVTVIQLIHPNFKTVTVTGIFGKSILKSNKTAGNNFDSNVGLLRKQKIAVNTFWIRESENWRGMPTILDVNFGREFFGWPEALEKNKAEKFAIKICHRNSLRNLPAIFLKFAGPK